MRVSAVAKAATAVVSSGICSTIMKQIAHILPTQRSHWVGDAFLVTPVFAQKAFTNDVSPFLMFDYGAPRELPPSNQQQQQGVGAHPHRGFETVSIAFQGEVEHLDSTGSSGTLGPGDVQWMTAGSGVIHQEYVSKSFMKTGGVIEMAQLWVNLPAKDKMTEPRYQSLRAKDFPTVSLNEDAGSMRIIAGKYEDAVGPAETHSPVNVFDLNINKGKLVSLEIEPGFRAIVFVRRGSIQLGESKTLLTVGQTVIMSLEGSTLLITEADADSGDVASVLVLSGLPLNEPIANRGPFVMNTKEELMEAFVDYQNGRLVRGKSFF